jgi:hypothetical protein
VRVDGILSAAEVETYRASYNRLLASCDAGLRYDLGAADVADGGTVAATAEAITQIMWPSDQLPELAFEKSVLHQRLWEVAKVLIGEDAVMDFDMLIDKRTDTPTPPHQDQSYWVELADKRAASFWVALDDATLDSGCMWYGAGDPVDITIRPHRKSLGGKGHALECDATEDEMRCAPIPAGSVMVHSGRTLHYSRGNTTGRPRRAFIVNFRPAGAKAEMRSKGYDHGRSGPTANAVLSTD